MAHSRGGLQQREHGVQKVAAGIVDQGLALALVCAADAIVSSDEDLLSLNPYRRIPVILARDFLEG